MGYFPIYLEMSGRRCLVIGGGELAERKTSGLLAAGAAVTVLSPDVTETIADWLSQKAITVIPRYYQPGDLAEFDLVFVATNDPQVNAVAYREGRSYGIWVNSADDPARCDFILPSVLRRGELTVAVSTADIARHWRAPFARKSSFISLRSMNLSPRWRRKSEKSCCSARSAYR